MNANEANKEKILAELNEYLTEDRDRQLLVCRLENAKNEFLCQFYEIYAGKILNHIADSYENISLSVLLKMKRHFLKLIIVFL